MDVGSLRAVLLERLFEVRPRIPELTRPEHRDTEYVVRLDEEDRVTVAFCLVEQLIAQIVHMLQLGVRERGDSERAKCWRTGRLPETP
jgi:hypothetical protein